jgi:hypothetical protein
MAPLPALLVAVVLLVVDVVLASSNSAVAGIGFSVLLIYLGALASFLWFFRR